MKTEKQQFISYLENEDFHVSSVLQTLDLIPHYRKTLDGHHTLISNISCCLFDGINTKPGDLGCVTFYYGGIKRRKCCRTSYQSEMLKKVILPKTCKEAIRVFEDWRIESRRILATWKTLI